MCNTDSYSPRDRGSGNEPTSETLPTSSCRLGYIRCPALLLFGQFLKEFTSEWSEANRKRMFYNLIQKRFKDNFWRRLTALVCENPGTDPCTELAIRLFLRRVFLDPLSPPNPIVAPTATNLSSRILAGPTNSVNRTGSGPHPIDQFGCVSFDTSIMRPISSHHDTTSTSSTQRVLSTRSIRTAAIPTSEVPTSAPLIGRSPSTSSLTSNSISRPRWPASEPLLHLLHSYPFVNQARILFILYGPLHRGRLMWRTMCENTAADSEQLSACFGELGSVLHNMLETGAWTSDHTLSVLNEVTTMPDEWLAENVACLLYTSGPRLASMLIMQKAMQGQTNELSTTLTSLCLVRVKIHANLTDLVGLVGDACRWTQHMDRRQFLDQLARAFQDVIVDLYETDEFEDRIDDFLTILRAQAEFMRALMARVYEE